MIKIDFCIDQTSFVIETDHTFKCHSDLVDFVRVATDSAIKHYTASQPDNSEPEKTTYIPVDNDQPDMVLAFMVCPCNPANGGSGVCGCTIRNRLVPNPKKYNLPQVSTNTSNTFDINGQSNYTHTTNICDVDESELCDIVLGNSSIINTKEQFEQYRKNIFYRYLSYEERYAIWFRNNFETGMEWNPAVVPDFNNSYYEPTPVKVIEIIIDESEIIEIYRNL